MGKSFKELRELALHQRQVYGRDVYCETYRAGGKVLAITRMHDDFHDMRLAILLDEGYTIKEVAVEMERIPYMTCLDVPPRYEALIGLNVFQKGVLKEARTRIARNEGCTHIMEMLESTFRSLFVSLNSERGRERAKTLEREESRQVNLQNPILQNSCWSFNTGTKNEDVLQKALKKLETKKGVPEPATPS